jgi:flagellin
MSLNSVDTNVAAMQALQALSGINRDLQTTQNRISTGLKVSSPKDNPAIWAIAQHQRGESRALEAVKTSLSRGQSIIDVAMSAGESISDLLSQMKEVALSAAEPSLSTTSRSALNNQYVALRRQIDMVSRTASFDGVSLISAGNQGRISALANSHGTSTLTVAHVDLSLSGVLLSGLPADLTGSISTAQLDAISDGMDGVDQAIASLGTSSRALDTHLTFIGKLQDVIDAGVGRLVDADMAQEAARLQALQVKQQLAIMALGIANQAPSMLLQLFQRR